MQSRLGGVVRARAESGKARRSYCGAFSPKPQEWLPSSTGSSQWSAPSDSTRGFYLKQIYQVMASTELRKPQDSNLGFVWRSLREMKEQKGPTPRNDDQLHSVFRIPYPYSIPRSHMW
jgi:hypothetical protein